MSAGPAFGLTEDNADLLWSPAQRTASGGVAFQRSREQLTALHPSYIRLLVDWAALQPTAGLAPTLDGAVSGCARQTAPCGAFAGLREEFAAIASQQRAARAAGEDGFQIVLDVFGTPAWAARPVDGCEPSATQPFSRPVTAGGLAGYRQLIGELLALGAQEGVQLSWWSPWNEPNNPQFLSPQRAACASDSPSLAPAVYAQLASAMAEALNTAGGTHHLLLGELASYATDSPHRTSIASFVAALPARVLCLSETWSIHAYPRFGGGARRGDSVGELERALDARGPCGRAASLWISETGAGAPHPGRPRRGAPGEAREGCLALADQLVRWTHDARIGAVLQYSFREDPAYPVGLLSADLTHVYPSYGLWLLYTRMRARGELPASPGALCA